MSAVREVRRLDVPGNWAELLLELGRGALKQMRRGAGIEEACSRLQCSLDYCQLALAFARASDLLKLRAMVENWSRDRIVKELGGPERVWPLQAGKQSVVVE